MDEQLESPDTGGGGGVDMSGVEDRLDDISQQIVELMTVLNTMNQNLGITLEWVMVLFFVVSVGLGVCVGYLLGKR